MLRPAPVSTTALERMLERARHLPLSYDDVGATRADGRPAGYRHDRYAHRLGGPADFARAREGLRHWQAHIGAGASVFPSDPVTDGTTVLLGLGLGPLRMVAPCRIVYVIDEDDRFGFAYGTLPGHPERGEELFLVARQGEDCTFTITAFSRPDQLMVRLGGALTRLIQARVTDRYLRSLERYVGRSDPNDSPALLAAPAVLVYDGDCGFCTSAATWIAAKWTNAETASAVPWQRLGDQGLERLGLTAAEVASAAWWVTATEKSGGPLAVARALMAAGGAWGLVGRLLLTIPVRPLAAVGYRLVARYRYRLPGGTPACKI